MARQVETRLALAACPQCWEGIRLAGKIYVGRQVVCPDCNAQLEVVEMDPAEPGITGKEANCDDQKKTRDLV